jgi:transcriptional regulator with XRE-family HTH domain
MSGPDSTRAEIRDFLSTRRGRLAPGDVGIPDHGRRRVAGLRREEVALLAGISVEYYTKIERGDAAGASPSVVRAIARVLQLDEVEHEHLRRLMLASDEADVHTMARASSGSIRAELQRLLDSLTDVPAYIVNKRLDIVGVNELGRALYSPMYDLFPHPVNTARFFFLAEDASRAFWEDWAGTAASGVAILRAEHALRPNDRDLAALIEELGRESAEFRARWATHDVHRHSTGLKIMNHPAVGHLELPYENMILPADPDLSMMTYNPEPGTASWDALRLLQIWARERQDARAGD